LTTIFALKIQAPSQFAGP